MPDSWCELRLVLPGAPRTKKNSASIQMAGRRKIVKPSRAWLDWRDDVLSWWLRGARLEARRVVPLPVAYPVNCTALFYRDRRAGDSTGYYQGLADVLQELGVVRDDVLITQWDGSRLRVDRRNPRVELVLTPADPDEEA